MVEVYYNSTTPSLDSLIFEIQVVVRNYDWQMAPGTFLVWFPDQTIASQLVNPSSRQVVVHFSDQLPDVSDIVLVIDTMLSYGKIRTGRGGYIIDYHRISRQQAEHRAFTTTHRMITLDAFRRLPVVSPIPPSEPFSAANGLALKEWKGDPSELLAVIYMLELIPLSGYYRMATAWKEDSDTRYDLEQLALIKEHYIQYVGIDHVHTLINMWNAIVQSVFIPVKPEFQQAMAQYQKTGRQPSTISSIDNIRRHLANYYPRLTRVVDSIHPLYMDDNGRMYQIGHNSLVSMMVATIPDEIVGLVLIPPSTLPGIILVGVTLDSHRIVVDFPDSPQLPNRIDEEITGD